MTNKEIAKVFKLLASLMELHGENAFKTRSYASAARNIDRFSQPLNQMSAAEVGGIQGIGKAISSKLDSLLTTGTFPLLDRLLEKTPKGVIDVLNVKGLGPKKVKVLWEGLGIESLGELLYACNENRLTALKGFGVKTQENIRKTVNYVLTNAHKKHYAALIGEAEALLEALNKIAGVEKVLLTGAMRRKMEVVEQIDILLVSENWGEVKKWCQEIQVVIKTIDEQKVIGNSILGTPIILHYSKPNEQAYHLFTTSAAPKHLTQIKELGDISAYINIKSEEALYQKLQLPYILPELREGRNEISLAQNKQLPSELVKVEDVKGILHAHSTYSDGRNTLEEMAKACKKLGYEYLGISDHSKAAFYAGGLTEVEIIQQHQEIDRLNKELAPFKIFKGIEADILSDGRLDYDDEILSSFDFVIASIHSNLRMTEDKAMMRLLKAVENPHTTILGHPTARLLLSREGYPIDHKKLIDACAANNVILELNAHPYRLDIDWRWINYCLEKNVLISVNPDAHSVEGILDVKFGINVARKGMLIKEKCFCCWNLEEVEKHFFSK